MRLLHPFMPFLTEEIWQHLPHEGESITVAKWPEAVKEYTDTEAAADMKLLVEVIRAVRNIRSEVNTPLSKQIELYLNSTPEIAERLEENRSYVERFTNPSLLQIGTDIQAVDEAMTAVVYNAGLIVPLEGLINIDEEISRLKKNSIS